MRLTILGNNGPFQGAGGACSGYLLQENKTNILIDCGNGVLGNLQKFIAIDDLDAVILTHLHSDHISDMMVLRYALKIRKMRGLSDKTLDVYTPSEPLDEFDRLIEKDTFLLNVINTETLISIGSLTITFSEMKHPYKCFGVCLNNGEKKLVYSGDTGWDSSIINFFRDADLLLLDAGLLEKDRTDNAPHMTAAECGTAASLACAKRLMLTHFWPEYDISDLIREAAANFPDVEAAELLKTYEI